MVTLMDHIVQSFQSDFLDFLKTRTKVDYQTRSFKTCGKHLLWLVIAGGNHYRNPFFVIRESNFEITRGIRFKSRVTFIRKNFDHLCILQTYEKKNINYSVPYLILILKVFSLWVYGWKWTRNDWPICVLWNVKVMAMIQIVW